MSASLAAWVDSVPLWALPLVLFPVVMLLVFLSNKFIPHKPPNSFLEPERWKAMELLDRKILNHNTRRYRFGLQREDQILGLPIGQHLDIQLTTAGGESVIKPYTPVSDDSRQGYVDFVIKVYPDGSFSPNLDKLRVGDSVLAKGPKGRFDYRRNMKRHIGMVAGGTGITPMWQTANQILSDDQDKTTLSLIYANVSFDDILIKDLLDHLAARYPSRFKVFYTLDQAAEDWRGGIGYVTADMIKEHIEPPADDVLVVRCGPPLMNKAVRQHLTALGYTRDMQFDF